MSQSKRKFAVEFKTRIALDALSGEHTLSELADWYGLHPNQVFQWERQAKEQNAPKNM
jgi:transposase